MKKGSTPSPRGDDATANEAGLYGFRGRGELVGRVRVEVGEASLDPSKDDCDGERVSDLEMESGELCCMESGGLCCTYS